ncbi:MAG TPA: nucleotidyltransferase [Actinomycetota bacterium]|jgi:predicted nucleotidyltransferase|nr:nucleotidyltransferase [Actinomycetota bacterium]
MLVPETVSEPTEITEADDGDLFLTVLDDAMAAMRAADIPFLLIGGIGSAVYGRDRSTRDIDLFVRPESAPRAVQALDAHGFDTRTVDVHWLSKAFKDGVLVDVIFRSSRDIYLDEQMLVRAEDMPFRGRWVPVAPPEDLVVMKAIAAAEDTPRYWYDALAIVGHADLDWDYLVFRARQHGARRILSLLLYASSVDLLVPLEPIEALQEAVGSGRRA